jgi:hypothetical protein
VALIKNILLQPGTTGPARAGKVNQIANSEFFNFFFPQGNLQMEFSHFTSR